MNAPIARTVFELRSDRLAIGDGCMNFRHFPSPTRGTFVLTPGALSTSSENSRFPRHVIDLNDPYIWVLDSRVRASFQQVLDTFMKEGRNNVLAVLERHDELCRRVKRRVGFYFLSELFPRKRVISEGRFYLNAADSLPIRPSAPA